MAGALVARYGYPCLVHLCQGENAYGTAPMTPLHDADIHRRLPRTRDRHQQRTRPAPRVVGHAEGHLVCVGCPVPVTGQDLQVRNCSVLPLFRAVPLPRRQRVCCRDAVGRALLFLVLVCVLDTGHRREDVVVGPRILAGLYQCLPAYYSIRCHSCPPPPSVVAAPLLRLRSGADVVRSSSRHSPPALRPKPKIIPLGSRSDSRSHRIRALP